MPADDEIFVWGGHIWGVADARKLLAGRMPTGLLDVEAAYKTMTTLGTRVDLEYAMAEADLTRPVLCVTVPGVEGGMVTIDGHHRIARAHEEGVGTLPYFLLTPEEEQSIKMQSPSKWAAPVRTAPRRSPFARSER